MAGSRTSNGRGLEARAPRPGRAARSPYHKRAAQLGAALRMVADTNAENLRGQAIDMQTPKRPTP